MFWPIVFEQQGGQSKATDKATRAIAEAVANCEGCKADTIRSEMNQRIAIILARAGAAMISRRQPGVRGGLDQPRWQVAANAAAALD